MNEKLKKETIDNNINVPLIGRKRISLYPGSLGIYDFLNVNGQIVDIPIIENYLEEEWDLFSMMPLSLINRFRAIQDTSITPVRNPRIEIELIAADKYKSFNELSITPAILNISEIVANSSGNFEVYLKKFQEELNSGRYLIRTKIKGTTSLRQSLFDLAFLAIENQKFTNENQVIGFGRLKILPKEYNGFIIISDIDKTFLDTKIETREGFIETLLEKIENKKTIKGMEEIYRIFNQKNIPLLFISASPEFFRRTLEAVFKKYNIEIDGLYLKKISNPVNYITSKLLQIITNFNEYINQNISEMMDRSLKFINTTLQSYVEQTAYKLISLLKIYKNLPQSSKIILIGDNTESDFIIFTLLQMLINNTIEEENIESYLYNLKFKNKNIISKDDTIFIKNLIIQIKNRFKSLNNVYGIYIHRAYEHPDENQIIHYIETTFETKVENLIQNNIIIPQIYENAQRLAIQLHKDKIINDFDLNQFNSYYSTLN